MNPHHAAAAACGRVVPLVRFAPSWADARLSRGMVPGMPGDHGYRLGYRPVLDGLRGIAVLVVVLGHTTGWTTAGSVGVGLFLVLSGFLITRLLVEELGRDGTVSLRGFYVRRLRRLGPGFLLFLPCAAAVGIGSGDTRALIASILQFSNIAGASGVPLGSLGHMWSLSLEEQFYLAWPLVFLVVRSSRALVIALLAATSASFAQYVWLLVSNAPAERLVYGPDVRVAPLLLGCVLGLCVPRLATARLQTWRAAGAIVGTTALAWAMPSTALRIIACTLGAAGVVAWAAVERESWPARTLGWGPLRWIGRRSYAIYLWHFPICGATWSWAPRAAFPVTLAVSVAVAALSWRCVEEPALRHRRASRAEPARGQALAA